jgi:YjbR protein
LPPSAQWPPDGELRLPHREAPVSDAADFRRIALALPGVAEYPHFDRRAFKARVTFATLAPDASSANLKFARDEQALKCAVAPDAFAALDNAWGRRGWTRATLAALSEPELAAALEMAWRHGAAKAKRRGALT